MAYGVKMAFRFESLEIWKQSIAFGHKIYDTADRLPKEESFGLASQLRRAAISIPNNIAEGSGNASTRDFLNFLDIAIKSALEVVSMLMFAEGRRYITHDERDTLYKEAETLIRQIRAFKSSLRTTIRHKP
jgi:four helix bundle protein